KLTNEWQKPRCSPNIARFARKPALGRGVRPWSRTNLAVGSGQVYRIPNNNSMTNSMKNSSNSSKAHSATESRRGLGDSSKYVRGAVRIARTLKYHLRGATRECCEEQA